MSGTRGFRLAVVVAGAVLLGACGGSDGGGDSKADWERKHGRSVTVLSQEIVAATTALDAGDRNAILGACNLLNDSLGTVRDDALPIADAAADKALRNAVAVTVTAATKCLAAGRSTAADDVEDAMDLMDDAQEAMDAAVAAIDAWT